MQLVTGQVQCGSVVGVWHECKYRVYEVLRYHRGVLRYALDWGGAQGLGGESTASCINYTGKNPPHTHKNY